MGIRPKWSSSAADIFACKPNPDPKNYRILYSESIGEYTILVLKYLDCTNYEGRKTLLYKHSMEQLLRQRELDPHFSEKENYCSPIARFEPTKDGLKNAVILARLLVLTSDIEFNQE